MSIDKNQNCIINRFSKDIHIWDKLSILGPRLMCHYFSYFSAPAVRKKGQEIDYY